MGIFKIVLILALLPHLFVVFKEWEYKKHYIIASVVCSILFLHWFFAFIILAWNCVGHLLMKYYRFNNKVRDIKKVMFEGWLEFTKMVK